jgi:hypothetical protein
MLYTVIMHMIETRNTKGLAEKVDVLYLANKLTDSEYGKICKALKGEE